MRGQMITREAIGRAGGRRSIGPNSAPLTIAPASVTTAAAAGTGVKPFWEYSPRAIPGAGAAAINVVNGNLLVAQTDADVHRPGVNLSFTRVYNSKSQHDAAGDDGSEPALFGNKWTNEYDMHFVYDPTASTVTIFDATGAAWVYTSKGCTSPTGWCAPKGQYATLATDPNDGCGFAWIQPSGVTYYMHDDSVLGCSPKAGVKGRLYEILGRNINDEIALTVTFDGTGSGGEDIREIDAAHSDGEQLKMIFAPVGAHTEMISLDMPNSMGTLSYLYDANGNLIEADRLGNGTTIPASIIPTRPAGQPFPTGDLPVTYSYYSGSLLYWAAGPRVTISSWQCGECGTAKDGGDLLFAYDSSSRLSIWRANGVLNFIPSDSLNTPLQGGYGAWADYDNGAYSYNTGYTTFADTPNHGAKWTFDTATGAVTGHGPCASTCATTPTYYWTTETRDGSLNVVSSVDPNGNETDFKYDSNGDLVEQIAPTPSPSGPFHRTVLYSYDDNHNLLSYCDPFATKALGKNNLSSPGQTPCPTNASAGATAVYGYNFPSPAGTAPPEPYGCLSDVYAANSTSTDYHTTFSYGGNCGDGRPTQAQGASINQSANNTSRQPVQSFTYYPTTTPQGEQGELESYSVGYGQWTYTYDELNRPTSATDPDGVTSYTCYNADGSVSATTTAKQYQEDGAKCSTHSTTYTYDADGNVTNVVHHYGDVARGTQKYYDGFDRLVEVVTPADSNIDGNNKTYTRYIYDLTPNGSVSMAGSASYSAHGNIYKTQECRSQCPTLTDLNGNAFDVMDRVVTRYQYTPTTPGNPGSLTPGTNPGPLEKWQNTYDVTSPSGQGELGLLTSTTDPAGTKTSLTYDSLNEVTGESFNDGNTPAAAYTYDPDGRVQTASNSVATDSYVWNPDGTLASDTEGTPTGSNFHNPATMTYGYYPDGNRMSLTITDGGVNFNQTREYAYRDDGSRTYLSVSGIANPFTWTYTQAGRVSSQTDPQNGSGPFASPEFPNGVSIGPKSLSYNGNGLLSTLTMPDGLKEAGFTYDAESEPTGFTVNAPGFAFTSTSQYPTNSFVTGINLGYDVLGELYQTQGQSPQASAVLQQNTFYFGHPESCDTTPLIPQCTTVPIPKIDVATGAIYSFPGFNSGNGANVCENISYDQDGRQSNNIETVLANPGGCDPSNAWISQKWKYDALNHVTSETFCPTSGGCNGTNTYSWDASGSLRIFNNSIVSYALHWDGDDLLLVTSGPQDSGSVEQYNIEKLAEKSGNALNVYDRDFSGTAVEQHTGQGDSGVDVTPDHFGLNKLGSLGVANITGTWPSSGTGGGAPPVVDMQRTDGYQIGGDGLTFQGVRTYDNNTQQWTTPDDFKGDVDDPKTQRAYQWNGNNPMTNVDPSGYCYADQKDNNGDVLSSDYYYCWHGDFPYGGVGGNNPAFYPFTAFMLRDAIVRKKWLEQPCHKDAVGKGATHVGIDAIGFLPGGTLPKLIGHTYGLRGAAAISSGAKTLRGTTGTLGAVQSASGAVQGDNNTDKGLAGMQATLSLVGLIPPPVSDVTSVISIGIDVLQTGKELHQCP